MTEPEPVVAEEQTPEVSASTELAVEPEATVTEEPVVTEPVTTEESTTAEDASDAELRAWAKENGIEGVPASGKLSATWREQIMAAMAAVLDPKDEASADSTSTDQSTLDSTDEDNLTAEELVVEYRSVYKAPNTFVTSQFYTT